MPTGTIKNYRAELGYGFIAPDAGAGNRDIFFHIKSFPLRLPEPGQHVSFDITPDGQGRPRAVNIRLLNATAALR
jgi:cold shock CspA family protein